MSKKVIHETDIRNLWREINTIVLPTKKAWLLHPIKSYKLYKLSRKHLSKLTEIISKYWSNFDESYYVWCEFGKHWPATHGKLVDKEEKSDE